jgi:hypothetical protein
MRSTRRGRQSVHEFGSSAEDSFVAVVVTKLTGALLFILLLTMTILVLIPRADESRPNPPVEAGANVEPLTLTLPESLPEAIVGRSYTLTLAARGGSGPLRWSIAGDLPEGLVLDPTAGRITGTPRSAPGTPVHLSVAVSDGSQRTSQSIRLAVLEPAKVLGWVDPSRVRPVPSWRSWLEHGFGFLVLGLVGLLSLNFVGAIERWSRSARPGQLAGPRWRFLIYRGLVVLATVSLCVALALWLVRPVP